MSLLSCITLFIADFLTPDPALREFGCAQFFAFQPPLFGSQRRACGVARLGYVIKYPQSFDEPLEGQRAIEKLRAGILRDNDHPGRDMGDAYGGVGFMNVLSAGAAGAECFYTHLMLQFSAVQ